MALAGFCGSVLIDGVVVSEAFNWTMDDEAESLDTTAFDCNGRMTSIHGLKQATGDIECRWNSVSDTGQLNMYNAYLNGTLVTLRLMVNQTSSYYYDVPARLMSVGQETPVDDIVSQTFSWEGQGAPTLVTTPPNALTVTSSPIDGATGVAVSANVVFTFSEALATATVTSANIFLEATVAGTLVPATLSLSAGNTVVTLDPNSNLSAATAYTAHVTTNVKSVDGSVLAATEIVNFTTA